MSQSFKIELPKIFSDLEKANFQDIFYDEDPYLSNCIIADTVINKEVVEKLVVSKVIFKNAKFIDVSFRNSVTY